MPRDEIITEINLMSDRLFEISKDIEMVSRRLKRITEKEKKVYTLDRIMDYPLEQLNNLFDEGKRLFR